MTTVAYDLSDFADDIAAEALRVAPTIDPTLELHVDGDYLAYHASGNEDASVATARKNVRERLQFFKDRTGAGGKVVMHMTHKASSKGERFLVSTVKPYQGNRDSGRKPKNWAYLVEYLSTHDDGLWKPKVWANREADDGIGVCSVHAASKGKPIVIATADKDMRMLPGIHVDWKSGHVTHVQPGDYDVVGDNAKQYGLKWFWLQMLQGDTADHIPGLEQYRGDWDQKAKAFKFKKMGEKTAEKMLEDCRTNRDAFERVRELYLNAYTKFDDTGSTAVNPGVWADRFVEQAALLWMRTDFDATVTDFAYHKGISCISADFDPPLLEATERLRTRVNAQRAKINSFADKAG